MARKRGSRRLQSLPRTSAAQNTAGTTRHTAGETPPTPPRTRQSWRVHFLAALVLITLAAVVWWVVNPSGSPAGDPVKPAPPIAYVGGRACAACHAEQHAALQGSHHERAMAVASEDTVLGDFANARFTHAGVTSTFFRRDGKYFVRTDGPDGKLADFEIRYTFGFTPLQQYLVPFPGGRLQALGIAWDSRPRAEGGQRWFHLYPQRPPKAGDPLHWTGIDQVWNYQCADCHSTNLRKNYDESTNRYATTWTDLNVGCEACHGPGSQHVAWANREGDWQHFADKGLTVVFDERRGANWLIDTASGNAVRSPPRRTEREIEVCARCHARRGQFSDDWHAGQPFADGFRASLLEPGLYYDDGQMRDEVYNYASLLESRMHAAGITCSDCHEPHTLKLRAEGSAVCGQCHSPAKFAVPAHHHHRDGSPGADCVACHMPTTTYMVVDPRHDHSFRIPRPDRSLSLGVPNACSRCHSERSAEWAARAVRQWFPQSQPGFQTFAETFSKADQGAPGAQRELVALIENRTQPAIVRASAVLRLGNVLGLPLGPSVLGALRTALADDHSLLRAAAANALAGADPATRLALLPPLLGDPRREVRMAAARALAGSPETQLDTTGRVRFERALAEYVAAEQFNADRPEGRAALGNLAASRGRAEEAIAAYRSALALDPSFLMAALNLADVYRLQGREALAEETLRKAIARDPNAAAAHFALGLALARQKRSPEALAALTRAATLAPEDARFALVLAVALADSGNRQHALATLERALRRHTHDRELLLTLAQYRQAGGEHERALALLRHLAELEPDDPQIAAMLAEIGRSGQ